MMSDEDATTDALSRLQVRWSVSSMAWLPESVFVSKLTELGVEHLRHESFAVEQPDADLEAIGKPVMVRRHRRGSTTVLASERGIVLIDLGGGSANVEVGAIERSHVDHIIEMLSDALGASVDRHDVVPVNFWALGTHGPRSAQRRITAPSWSEIEPNYDDHTGRAVAELLTSRAPDAGRLVLWHGPPGTGKTYVVRALARRWSDWCSTHFITDPEAFLGAGSSYLLDVLTSHESRRTNGGQWKLVVLEDSGELLAADAHERTGQALSRLLNVTDGMLGQGMNTIVLVSTNEPLGQLHPAIQRPGRCWHEIEFGLLSVATANRWLDAHGSSALVSSPTSLADLFAIDRGERIRQERPFGFSAN